MRPTSLGCMAEYATEVEALDAVEAKSTVSRDRPPVERARVNYVEDRPKPAGKFAQRKRRNSDSERPGRKPAPRPVQPRSDTGYHSSDDNRANPDEDWRATVNSLCEQVAELKRGFDSQRHVPKRSRFSRSGEQSTRREPREPLRCWSCGEAGHKSVECESETSRRATDEQKN